LSEVQEFHHWISLHLRFSEEVIEFLEKLMGSNPSISIVGDDACWRRTHADAGIWISLRFALPEVIEEVIKPVLRARRRPGSEMVPARR
jgi:hypothetical protein